MLTSDVSYAVNKDVFIDPKQQYTIPSRCCDVVVVVFAITGVPKIEQSFNFGFGLLRPKFE